MVCINGLNDEKIMDFAMLKQSCKEEETEGRVEIIDENKNYISIEDVDSGKVITFTDPLTISKEFLEKKIHIGKGVAEKYGLSSISIAQLLHEWLNPNHFITLEDIFIVHDEDDLRKTDTIGNAYKSLMFSDLGFDEFVGITLYNNNSIVVSVVAIEDVAKECCFSEKEFKEEVILGIETTLFHEMRHLMFDTNIYLPEEIYALPLACEDEVEDFGIRTYEAKTWNK